MMRRPVFMPAGTPHLNVTVDAKGPLRVTATLEQRCGQPRLMWFLDKMVSPWMGNVIVNRFAYEGDKTVGGPWPPLAEYTVRLKRSLGYPLDPNERTGDMLYHLTYEHAVEPWSLGALLRIPGQSDPIMEQKIRTAQIGEPAGQNPLTPSGTPPRPVLGIGEFEEHGISALLSEYMTAGL